MKALEYKECVRCQERNYFMDEYLEGKWHNICESCMTEDERKEMMSFFSSKLGMLEYNILDRLDFIDKRFKK